MKIGYIFWYGFIAALFLAPIPAGGLDPTTSDALKVKHILKTIESHQSKSGKAEIRTATITQKELNAYFTYRLSQEENPLIKKVDIRLDDDNRVRGKVSVDLEGVQILNLFGTDLRFDFDGGLKTEAGGGKLELTSLYLNGDPVPPKALDPVLFAVARYYGHEPGSIDDWYELPRGIKRIQLKKAKAILHY